MSYASRIKQKKFDWGGKALFAAFPAHGEISIVGSLKGGAHLAQTFAAQDHSFICNEWGDELADIHASMLLDGTKKKNKKNIQVLLDGMGASLSFSADKNRLNFTARVRAVHAEKMFSLIAEALTSPTFPASELAHLKARMLADLALEAKNTRMQASINLSRTLFPAGHPNRHEETAQARIAVEAMTRTKILKYHERAIDGSSLIISIAGDISREHTYKLVEKYFSRLPREHPVLAPFKEAQPKKAKPIRVHIEDKASIDYILGIATAITNRHSDYPALILGLQILGNRGGFTGRLMRTVREEKGLTYGVYAFPGGFSYGTDGYISIWGNFAPALWKRGRTAIMEEIKKIITDGVPAKEVRRHAQLFDARSRVLSADSMSLAHVAHDIAAENRAPSYLDEFPKMILEITPKQVNAALKKYLVPEKLTESSAGPVEGK